MALDYHKTRWQGEPFSPRWKRMRSRNINTHL